VNFAVLSAELAQSFPAEFAGNSAQKVETSAEIAGISSQTARISAKKAELPAKSGKKPSKPLSCSCCAIL
jgi:hypothetical protein